MSWVKNHWEEKYIATAERSIWDLVRLVFIFLNGILSVAPKMAQYCEKSATSEDAERLGQNIVRSPVSNLTAVMISIYNMEFKWRWA